MSQMVSVQHYLTFYMVIVLKNLKKIISLVTVSKISLKYALAKFHLIDLALKGSKNPIKEFTLKYKNKSYFKNIVKNINKIKRLKKKPHPQVVKKNLEWLVVTPGLLRVLFILF